jgi:hypothetical protein
MSKPSIEGVLTRYCHRLGPQRSAAHLLSHLGDDAVIKPFPPGDEPSWTEVLVYLMAANPHISFAEVVRQLNSGGEAMYVEER